jgi:2-(1,2-epoxy-1,2-dihydrophenyl)acetyl-CoA isomerase
MNSYETIQFDTKNHIATITLNRPDKYNAITTTMLRELVKAFKTAERDADVRVIVLTGAGKAFCAGQDLSDVSPDDLSFKDHLRTYYSPLISHMRRLEKPIVGAINGVAAGAGLGLALACDIRVMSSKAGLVFAAFSRIALIPDAGLTYHLPRLLGTAKAYELLLLGDNQNRMDAETAHRWGLCTTVADADNFAIATTDFATHLAGFSVHANGLTKRMLNASWNNTLDAQLDLEAQVQQTAGQHPDVAEGVQAFLEKRPANFNQK